MKAIRFNLTIPRYLTGLLLGKISPGFYWSGLSCTTFVDIPEPEIIGDEWIVIRTHYGGICGSDMSAIHLHASPYLTPLMSSPFTFGHENIGVIARTGSAVDQFGEGERVVVEPTLWCRPRGFADLCPYCQRGETNRCERVIEGDLSPSLSIGFSKDTGGSWSPYFLAHQSQLYRIPDTVNDENGLMVEPFATGIHAVLKNPPSENDLILIIGAGTIGLCTLAAMRASGFKNRIHVLARYPFQAESAHKLGADEVILTSGEIDYYKEISQLSGAKILEPIVGKRLLLGGYDKVYECVGSDTTVDDALRFTRNGGLVVLVGVPGVAKNVDWSAIFIHELRLKSSYIYNHAEVFNGRQRSTFDIAIDWMAEGRVDLGWMVTHRFKIEDYSRAFTLQSKRAENQSIKTIFEFN
jgi:L-iditol 2-dehydrogenase